MVKCGFWATERRPHNPLVVVLTPGQDSETFFEHSFLANYLGYPLVEGEDLTARGGYVWLKSLNGLQQVDVILRRIDDTYCDPLELRQESLLGIPGLLQAARMGHVAIANPLGSGIVENPALMAFLPSLCRYLLGEELRIPSVATWWCGQPKERQYVREHLDELVIKPTYRHPMIRNVFCASLSSQEKEALVQKIEAEPNNFVAQEWVHLSTTPFFTKNTLEPRRMVLRTFMVSQDSGYSVMPGGLTRVAPDSESMIVSSGAGGSSKDTWVIASEPERDMDLYNPTGAALKITRTGSGIPAVWQKTSFGSPAIRNGSILLRASYGKSPSEFWTRMRNIKTNTFRYYYKY